MTSATLHSSGLSSAQRPGVGDALHGLAVAAQGVVVALWAAVSQPPRSTTEVATLTAFEEAENVRAIADEWLQSDPRFAQELYCAANRHELASRNASPSRF
jgi:hypothetical protein